MTLVRINAASSKLFAALPVLLVLSAIVLWAGAPGIASVMAQDGADIKSGVIVGVEATQSGELERFALSDQAGTITEFTVQPATEYGLENQAGDRWVATQASAPVEVVGRLRDHQARFAPVTVSSQNGVAVSVVERESGRLETNLGFLFAVFALTWAGFFAYIFFVSRRQRQLQQEMARLRASLNMNSDE